VSRTKCCCRGVRVLYTETVDIQTVFLAAAELSQYFQGTAKKRHFANVELKVSGERDWTGTRFWALCDGLSVWHCGPACRHGRRALKGMGLRQGLFAVACAGVVALDADAVRVYAGLSRSVSRAEAFLSISIDPLK
jgi:hypothetical protein